VEENQNFRVNSCTHKIIDISFDFIHINWQFTLVCEVMGRNKNSTAHRKSKLKEANGKFAKSSSKTAIKALDLEIDNESDEEDEDELYHNSEKIERNKNSI